MKSAFSTVLAAAGVGSACYSLAVASWDQVLLIFLFASFGWCLFVWFSEKHKNTFGPRLVAKRTPELIDKLVAPYPPLARAAEPMPRTESNDAGRQTQSRQIYKFPIHKLASLPQRLGPMEQ